MSEAALTTAPAPAAPAGGLPGLPPAVGDMVSRARGLWDSPAVRAARPALAVLGVLAAGALAWMALNGPQYRPLYPGMAEADAAAVTDALAASGFAWRVNPQTGTVEVAADDIARARILLAGQGLPKSSAGGTNALDAMPLGASRSVEPTPITAALVRRLIRLRRDRDRHFPAEIFADPAWDMLLDLTAARLEQVDVPVSSLCVASAVPTTTALRWIRSLIEAGLLVRRTDPIDARRAFITLSDQAHQAMLGWLRRFAAAFSPR